MPTSRIVALSLLAVPAVALSACGSSGSSDKDQLSTIITSVARTPSKYCDDVSKAMLAQIGGLARCQAGITTQGAVDPNPTVNSVTVSGSSAVVHLTDRGGKQAVKFVKENGKWRVAAS